MKRLLLSLFSLAGIYSAANAQIENVIIVTTDGFRWQEVFKGMDSSLAADHKFNQNDSAGIFGKYWAQTAKERRSKLMPFLWNTVGIKGEIYGNRDLGVKVNNANPYWFSYPGYNEIFTGNVDTAVNSNDYPANPNTNVLEWLNKQKEFKGKVAAFCAWEAFNRILNEERSGLPIVAGKDACGGASPDAAEQMLNQLKNDVYYPWGQAEAFDVFTQYAAMDYLQKQQPRIMYASFGETDEWAHAGHYKDYLDAAHRVDKWLNDIWSYIQSNPHYKDKTLLFITVDHGRGEHDQWTSHNAKIPHSNEMWCAMMGPKIAAKGEMTGDIQLYQKQFAQTIAHLLGYKFTCEHPVADGFNP